MTENRRQMKVSDSLSTQSYIVMYPHLNGAGVLFGGQLLEWMDMLAGIVALRHSDHQVVTAAIDDIAFIRSAKPKDVVTLVGRVTYVGTTSMEVMIEVFIENRGGEKKLANEAFFLMVAIDDETGKPTEVPELILESDEDRKYWEEGKQRYLARKTRRKKDQA